MHLDEEQVQRLLHGELGPSAEALARSHLGGCSECRFRLGQAEREEEWVFDRLRGLDHIRPPVSVESVLALRGRRVPAWGRLAAGIFLALTVAGVAYALPGSPLPRVIDHLIQLARPAPKPTTKTTPLPASSDSQAGIAIAPGSRLTIVFPEGRSEDTVVVSLTDDTDVLVRAPGGGATFTSDADRLSIGHRGPPARFEILIPRGAPLVEVRAGSRRILFKEGSRISTAAEPEPDGRYLIPLSRSKP
jgi:hypothetical protein